MKDKRWFLIAFTVPLVCQLALLIQELNAIRLIFRIAAFGTCLAALFVYRSRSRDVPNHPAQRVAIAIVGLLTISVCHPTTPTLFAGFATVAFYLSVLAPIFWVSKLRIEVKTLELVIWILFGFHSLSAIFGVLQCYFPGRFQPAISEVVMNSRFGLDAVRITMADGTRAIRPTGLTNIPGGAGVAGYQATVFGLALLLRRRGKVQWLGAGGIAIGLFCIYLSQIRSLLVLAGVMFIALFALLWVLNKRAEAIRIVTVGSILFAASFAWAIAVGGKETRARFSSMLVDRPTEVYNKNRGHFLTSTINDLAPEYPLGAGLARWGMMYYYFGSKNSYVPMIWAEIQWTGWLLDGGLLLVGLYAAALLIAIQTTYQAARAGVDSRLTEIAVVILAYDIGIFAQTFGSVPMSSQLGIEFWLLNTAIFTCTMSKRLNTDDDEEEDDQDFPAWDDDRYDELRYDYTLT